MSVIKRDLVWYLLPQAPREVSHSMLCKQILLLVCEQGLRESYALCRHLRSLQIAPPSSFKPGAGSTLWEWDESATKRSNQVGAQLVRIGDRNGGERGEDKAHTDVPTRDLWKRLVIDETRHSTNRMENE